MRLKRFLRKFVALAKRFESLIEPEMMKEFKELGEWIDKEGQKWQ